MNKYLKDLLRGLWNENPTFRLLIGLCPTLGVTTEAIYGLSMALATTFVLIFSSAIISMLKRVIPDKVRIPAYIIIIATLVTVISLLMQAYLLDLYAALGVFIPLIVVNCIILGRAEAYASKMPVFSSIFDAFVMGLGFTWALTLLGSVRELLGTGKVFGTQIMPDGFTAWGIMSTPPGAFLTLGFLLALVNFIGDKVTKTIAASRQKIADQEVA